MWTVYTTTLEPPSPLLKLCKKPTKQFLEIRTYTDAVHKLRQALELMVQHLTICPCRSWDSKAHRPISTGQRCNPLRFPTTSSIPEHIVSCKKLRKTFSIPAGLNNFGNLRELHTDPFKGNSVNLKNMSLSPWNPGAGHPDKCCIKSHYALQNSFSTVNHQSKGNCLFTS